MIKLKTILSEIHLTQLEPELKRIYNQVLDLAIWNGDINTERGEVLDKYGWWYKQGHDTLDEWIKSLPRGKKVELYKELREIVLKYNK